MLTITQYREKIGLYMKKLADMNARCAAENREMTEEERSLKKEIMDKVSELQDIVATEERHERLERDLRMPANAPLTQPRPEGQPPESRKERFKSLGEQLVAAMRAAQPGSPVDPRLLEVRASGLNESVPSEGGFLVQTDFSNELLQQVFQTGILAPRCRRITISGNANGIKINGVDETSRASTRSGGILGYWKNEAAQKTSSKPAFRQIELNLHKLIGLCYATDELLADAVALEAFIREAFAAEFGFLLDDAIIRGTGSGQPLGILNSGCLVTVSKQTGQTADTVVWENVVDMYARLFAQSRPNAVWLVNQQVEPQLMKMAMAVGTGGVPVYMPAGGASQSPYATLFGRPVIACEQCSALGDVGDIIFADFGGYILAEKGGIESAMSIHVKFDYDESVFRFVLRVDGQPVRASALTPYKGGSGATLSHFVTLAAR